MKELNEKVIEILENNGFNIGKINTQDDNYYIDLQQYTQAGEDWYVTIWFNGTDKDFVTQVEEYYNNFDVDEETEILIESRGKNGVPSSIRTILEDQEWKDNKLKELSDNLDNLEL